MRTRNDNGQPLNPRKRVPPITRSTTAAISLMLSLASLVTLLTGTMFTKTVGDKELALLALIVTSPRIRRIMDEPRPAGGMTFAVVFVAFALLAISLAF